MSAHFDINPSWALISINLLPAKKEFSPLGLSRRGVACKLMSEIKTDVIAQWNADGTMIPLRIRVHTEDNVETYTIQGYQEIEHETTEVHGVFVTAGAKVWECSIVVNGARNHIWLYFDGRWRMRY